jgi:hypothetical protein
VLVIEPEDRFDRFMFWFVKRFPGWFVAVVAVVFYPGIALVVPVTLGASGGWLIGMNLLGAISAPGIILWWLIVQLAARDRRHLLEWTTDLRLLDGDEFASSSAPSRGSIFPRRPGRS